MNMREVSYSLEAIGYGDDAIYNTVKKMKDIISVSSRNPEIREWARKIVADVAVNDKFGEARAIFNFVRDNVRYTRDPKGWEYIQTPPVLLESIGDYWKMKSNRPIGDCDDMTVLSLSLAKSIGFPTALKVVSYRNDKKYQHVYGLVEIDGKWVAFDTVRPDREMGWQANGVTRTFESEV